MLILGQSLLDFEPCWLQFYHLGPFWNISTMIGPKRGLCSHIFEIKVWIFINVLYVLLSIKKCNKMEWFYSGGRCHWHHNQASHGNMDRHAEWQNRKFQVHLRGHTEEGELGNTNPQSETQINCPGSAEASQSWGILLLFELISCSNPTILPTESCSFSFLLNGTIFSFSGIFHMFAAGWLPNCRRLDEAEGESSDGAECDWSRAQAASARCCQLPAATALWVMNPRQGHWRTDVL